MLHRQLEIDLRWATGQEEPSVSGLHGAFTQTQIFTYDWSNGPTLCVNHPQDDSSPQDQP